MRIVNTFISESADIPDYTEISLRQARNLNPDVIIDFISLRPADYFDELRINWIDQQTISSDLLDDFRSVCWFDRHDTPNTTYPSPVGFWQKTAERIYYLQDYIRQFNLKDVIHFENDVLIYDKLEAIKTNDYMMAIPMSANKSTFAFCYIPSSAAITSLCSYFNWLLSHYGESQLTSYMRDHISEMSMLNLAMSENLVQPFPIIPTQGQSLVFDPGSYGQFLGGTNNGHKSGFTDPEHFIGKLIAENELQVRFENMPYVNDTKIFNLHIHSKNLQRFV